MKRNLLKGSCRLMLLCSLSLLMVLSISSCQQSKLKAVVAIANKQCPIEVEGIGKVTSIIYDKENVVYTLNMNEDIVDISVLKENPESMKETIKAMFLNPEADVKELLNLIAACNAGLQMKFVGQDSGEEAVCRLAPEDVKEVLNANSTPEQSKRAQLETQLKMANLQFPMQASDEVLIEKVELEDESVVYICKVDEDVCSISQIEESAKEIKKEVVASLTEQDDTATQLFLQTCIDNDKNITYRYIGSESDDYCDIVITLPELKKMIVKK